MTENRDQDIFEIEINPNALDYLKKKGDVFILTDIQNPQYAYYRIQGYDAKLIVKFEEFVEVCKTYPDPQTSPSDAPAEFNVTIFDVTSPANSKPSNLGFYVVRSGFQSVKDWLKTLKEDEIPECETGPKKTFYLYHIQTIA